MNADRQTNETMNLLTAYAWPRSGGMSIRFVRAMLVLAEEGIDVHWITAQPVVPAHKRITIRRVNGMGDKEPHSVSIGFWIRFNLKASWNAVVGTRAVPPDGFFSFSLACAVPLLPAVVLRRKPLLVFVRSDEDYEYALKIRQPWLLFAIRCFNSLVVKRADRLVFVNKALRDRFLSRYCGACEHKSVLLYNEVPLAVVSSSSAREELESLVSGPSAPFIVVSVGRMSALKNMQIIVRAICTLKHTGIRLVLVGDGPERASLEAMVEQMNGKEFVSFTGWRDDAERLISACDAFVLPSFSEGVSNALLTALGSKRLCLLSDIEAHRELFPSGQNLFGPEDGDRLMDLLEGVVENGERAEFIGRACAAAREMLSFDWNAAVRGLIDEAFGRDVEGRARMP